MSTQTFEIQVQGVTQLVTVTAEFEAPDRECGVSGGWFLVGAKIVYPRHWRRLPISLDRQAFAYVFGSEALRVAEENIADLVMARLEDACLEG